MVRCKRVSRNKWHLRVTHCFHILWLIRDTLSICYETQTELTETPIKIHPQVISPSYEPNLHLENCVKFRVVPGYISMDEKGHGIRTTVWHRQCKPSKAVAETQITVQVQNIFLNLHIENSCRINQWLKMLKQELLTMLKWELTKFGGCLSKKAMVLMQCPCLCDNECCDGSLSDAGLKGWNKGGCILKSLRGYISTDFNESETF